MYLIFLYRTYFSVIYLFLIYFVILLIFVINLYLFKSLIVLLLKRRKINLSNALTLKIGNQFCFLYLFYVLMAATVLIFFVKLNNNKFGTILF